MADPPILFRGDFQHLFLQLLAVGDIADHAGEKAQVIDLADGQVHRKRGTVLAHAGNLTAHADDVWSPGFQVAGDVVVVLVTVRRRHEHANVLT